MDQQIDPRAELERLKSLPLDERTSAIEELIERLERRLEEKSPRPPAKP